MKCTIYSRLQPCRRRSTLPCSSMHQDIITCRRLWMGGIIASHSHLCVTSRSNALPLFAHHVSDFICTDNRTNTRGVNPVFTSLQAALNPHRKTPFLVRPNKSARLHILKLMVALAKLTVSSSSSDVNSWHLDKLNQKRSDNRWALTNEQTNGQTNASFFFRLSSTLWPESL